MSYGAQPKCAAIEILKNVLFFFYFLLITPMFMPENFRKDYINLLYNNRRPLTRPIKHTINFDGVIQFYPLYFENSLKRHYWIVEFHGEAFLAIYET